MCLYNFYLIFINATLTIKVLIKYIFNLVLLFYYHMSSGIHGTYMKVRLWPYIKDKYLSKSTLVMLFTLWGIVKKDKVTGAGIMRSG